MKPNSPDYKNRNYLIFNVSEINLIDFDEVYETSEETLRKSLDGTKTFIKWDETIPQFINSLTTKEGPYTYDEMMVILETSEWTKPFVTN